MIWEELVEFAKDYGFESDNAQVSCGQVGCLSPEHLDVIQFLVMELSILILKYQETKPMSR